MKLLRCSTCKQEKIAAACFNQAELTVDYPECIQCAHKRQRRNNEKHRLAPTGKPRGYHWRHRFSEP